MEKYSAYTVYNKLKCTCSSKLIMVSHYFALQNGNILNNNYYPAKKLCGISPDTFYLADEAVGQVG